MSYRRSHIKPKIRRLKPKKHWTKNPVVWVGLGTILLLFTIPYFLFFFPKFQINTITILGNEHIPIKSIEQATWFHINQNIFTKSIVTLSTKALSKDLLGQFPATREVMIKKDLPRGITIEIQERKSIAVFCQQSCFSIDQEGIIFEEVTSADGMMVIKAPQQEISLGNPIVEKKIITLITTINNHLSNNFQIEVRETFVSNPLILTTSEHWDIYLDPSSDTNLQIAKMNALLKDEIPEATRKHIQYLYLQYKDRAYYK